MVLDPDGTSWDLLQAGAGYYYGTMKHCKPVGKLIVELRRPTEADSPVAKAILAVGSISVDLQTPVVRCGAGLDTILCTSTEAVWRHLAKVETVQSGEAASVEREAKAGVEGCHWKVIEKRRIPYRRIGMVVAFAHKLSVAQRTLVEKVRCDASEALNARGMPTVTAVHCLVLLLPPQLGERSDATAMQLVPDSAGVFPPLMRFLVEGGNGTWQGYRTHLTLFVPPASDIAALPGHWWTARCCDCLACAVAERERLASELMVLLSPVLRQHANIGKGYAETLGALLARSDSKDCLIELLCKGVVSGMVAEITKSSEVWPLLSKHLPLLLTLYHCLVGPLSCLCRRRCWFLALC